MKFVSFYCNREKKNVSINPEAVTVIRDEDCKAWGNAEISVKGGSYISGIMTVHVSQSPEAVRRMLVEA